MKLPTSFLGTVLAVLTGNAITLLARGYGPWDEVPLPFGDAAGKAELGAPDRVAAVAPVQAVDPAAPAPRRQIASRWVPLIQSRIRSAWERPPNTIEGLDTVVNLRLEPGGSVEPGSVRVVQSSGDAFFDDSVIAAVYAASPLPVPSGDAFEALFRDFNFRFRL
jgi:TolA protein